MSESALTEKQIEAQKLSAQRIKEYRKNDLKLSQEEFGFLIDKDKQTVARYEKGQTKIPTKVIETLMSKSGYIREYWMGLTPCKTHEEFAEECEAAFLKDQALFQQYENRRREQISALMNLCGFGYEDYGDGTAGHDFIELSDDLADRKVAKIVAAGYVHKITCSSKAGESVASFFSNKELSSLLSDISDLIAFRCFQKSIHRE